MCCGQKDGKDKDPTKEDGCLACLRKSKEACVARLE